MGADGSLRCGWAVRLSESTDIWRGPRIQRESCARKPKLSDWSQGTLETKKKCHVFASKSDLGFLHPKHAIEYMDFLDL